MQHRDLRRSYTLLGFEKSVMWLSTKWSDSIRYVHRRDSYELSCGVYQVAATTTNIKLKQKRAKIFIF